MHISFPKFVLRLILLGGLLLITTSPIMAQNRIIKGKITSDKGEPVAGAQVLIQGVDINREYKVKTNNKGEYLYLGIPAGVFRVIARADGFQPSFRENIRPSIQEDSIVDLTLNPGEDYKLPFELTQEEIEQLEAEVEKAQKRKAAAAEVKASFDAGLQLAGEGKYAEAIAEFNKAIDRDPEQAYVYANMADAYAKLEKYDESLAAYQNAAKLEPKDAVIQMNMGVVLSMMGKIDESQEVFKKAAEMDPGSAAKNYYNLGATLVNSGRSSEATEAFKQAIAADANFEEAYFQLGMCLSGSSDTIPDAIKALQKYIQIGKKPDQVEVAKQIIAALETQSGN